jgi:hypothetical protein
MHEFQIPNSQFQITEPSYETLSKKQPGTLPGCHLASLEENQIVIDTAVLPVVV